MGWKARIQGRRYCGRRSACFPRRDTTRFSVRDIARAVGIKESSLYNHFTNKQHIFDSIIEEYYSRGAAFFNRMQLLGDDMEFKADQATVQMYRNMPPEAFEAATAAVFEYYFTDELSVKLRRMLTMEQYRNESVAKAFRELSFDAALEFQSQLFGAMIEAGLFIRTDPYILALEFFAPIFLIFYKYDNDATSLEEARALFTRHIRHFSETYAVKR